MSNYKKYRRQVGANFNGLMRSFRKLFYYGCEVDSWLPEIIILPYVTLQWKQDRTWFRIIAPPGSGKSVHLSLLRDYELSYVIDEFTPKSFISGFRGSGGEDPSILPQLDGKVLILSDESTIMEQRQEDRNQIQAILRKTYDGTYGKKFGNIKDKQEYSTYFNLLIGSTPAIDRYFLYNQALGERYINFRLQIPNREALARFAYENQFQNFGEKYAKLQKKLHRFLKQLPSVDFSDITVSDTAGDFLINVSNFIALIRTKISRDGTGQHVTTLPQAESAGRLVHQMTQTAMASAVVNGDLEVELLHLHKAIYFGIGSVMAIIIFILHNIYLYSSQAQGGTDKVWFSPQTIGIRTALSLRTILKILEDLAIHHVLDVRQAKKQGGRLREYSLNDEILEFIEEVEIFKYYSPPCKEILSLKRLDRTRPTGNKKRKKKRKIKNQ